ncbi:MFS transporter [Marinomonas sp. 2405UD68-3]|uniref:MFS transporter n=1 Tax=Marinomonas sp. 2405UD68-3 TaxID=3391835 RepID=UPI0039C95CB3
MDGECFDIRDCFFLETLPRFLSFPIAGILCDHLSPYKVINFSQKTRFIIISLGLLGNFFVDSVYWLIAISAFTGIATSFGAIAREVIIPQAFKHARLEKVMSFTSLSDQLGIVAGPVLAVALLEFLDWEVVLIIGALLFVLSDLLIKFWNNESAVEIKTLNEDKIDIVHSIKVSCGHIIKLNGLLPAIILAFSINLILGTALASVVPMYTGTYE